MSNPICPIHQREMRDGKFGWYCAQKKPDGTWCDQKVKFPKKEEAPPPITTEPESVMTLAPVPSQSKTQLACAALNFAGLIYQGSGAVGADEALDLASKTLSLMSLEEGVG